MHLHHKTNNAFFAMQSHEKAGVMPKVVDHNERRLEIVEAVYRVIERDGMEAVSLRDVAKEASVSMGTVQHYFRTKNEMLLFALGNMRERVLARLTARLLKLKDPTRRQYMREVAKVMLPIDQASRQEAAVNIAFFATALADEHLQSLLREGYDRLLQASTQILRDAQGADELEPGVDPDVAAATLFFVIQGLIGPTLISVMRPKAALAIVDRQLESIFK